MPSQTLEEVILVAFKRACALENVDVADHLLRALEAIERDPHENVILGEAYLSMCSSDLGCVDKQT